jgi:hypothetical protein
VGFLNAANPPRILVAGCRHIISFELNFLQALGYQILAVWIPLGAATPISQFSWPCWLGLMVNVVAGEQCI